MIPVSLNHSVKDVDVGLGFSLTATVPSGGGGTLEWSSSNTYVATVSSSGYVTGHHAGTAVITATYTRVDGATGFASCTVYVTVADGLCYLKNASSDLCFYTGGSAVSLQAQQTDTSSRIGQLWKIRYVSGGKYEICPIRDTSVALTADSGNYVTVGEAETTASWGIVQNSFGYSIQYLGSNDEVAKPVVADMPGTQIYLGDWQAGLTCHWELEAAAGLFFRDAESKIIIDSSDVRYMELDVDATWADMGLIYEGYGSVTGGITRVSSDNSIVTFDDAGSLDASKRGRVTITVSENRNGALYTQTIDLIVRETIMVINVMDSTISNEIKNDISDAVDFLNEIYDAYYLHFVSEGEPYLDPLAAVDNCPHGNAIDCDENCGDTCDDHHLNVNRIAEDLYERFWRENSVVVMWSNSPRNVFCWCYERAGGLSGIAHSHQMLDAYGVQTSSENSDGELVPMPIVQMININNGVTFGENCSQLQLMSIVLAHEIAHTLGLEEMYNNTNYPNHDGNDKRMQCIMELIDDENRDDLSAFYQRIVLNEDAAFCSTCLNRLSYIPNDVYEH